MTEMQARFVEEYLKDMNARQAAIRAGYAADCAHVTGHRLRNANKRVKAAIDAQVDEARAKAKMSADEVLERMTVRARANIGDYLSWTANAVTIKPSCELTEAQLYGVRRVVLHQEVRDQEGRVTSSASVKELEIADPRRALEYLGRVHGLDKQGSAATRRADVTVESAEPGVILILPDNGRGDGPPPLPPLPPKLP
jgi:phage terminase small subunit